MRINTQITIDIETGDVIDRQWYWYDGPIARCDRAAQGQASRAAGTAESVAGQEQNAAQQAQNQLFPFYRGEMLAQHLFQPGQTQTLLNAAEAPLAASAATAQGQAASQAARTRNAAGFSSALDQAARDRNAALGQAGENIAAEDIRGAKALNQAGAEGMSGLFKTDTGAMLTAMGQVPEDINAEVNAGKSGWFQNTLSTLNALKPGGNQSWKDMYSG